MCGIAGIVYADPRRAVDPGDLARMARALAHRGPDGEGIWADGPVGLAHRRLAIIDLTGGRQPMTSAASGVVLTFNGEIYNYRELRTELGAHGARFHEHSDTEVVLRAYEHWGSSCVDHFRGMFALALWDPRSARLFAARDRLGIKPFYYQWDGASLRFASELQALLAAPASPPSINDEAFEAYLRLQYIPSPLTLIKGVRQLQPGRTLTLSSGGRLAEDRYWRPVPAAAPAATPGADAFERHLRDAVASHLVADVPVGAFLSGGVDSSLIVAEMRRLTDAPLHTFSVGFEGGARFDERSGARQVAVHLGTVHHEQLISEADVVDGCAGLMARMDEPLADYAALPTYFVSALAARHVKVVLTGEGADELFGGYRRYRRDRLLGPLRALGGRYQASHLFSAREVERLIGRKPVPLPAANGAGPAPTDPLNRLLLRDIEGWLPDDLLVKVDRMTMLCSLEARVPYLDHRFVEYALSVPGSQKINAVTGTNKLLMREAAAGMLPADVASRPKHGFTPPVDAWLRGGLHQLARESLLGPGARSADRVDRAEVRRLLDGQLSGRTNGHKLWSLLVYEFWSRQHRVA